MIPFERELYVDMLVAKVKEQNDKNKTSVGSL